MRPLILAGLAALAVSLPAQAALPPQYQRQNELKAIVETPEIYDAFGFDPIEAITEVETDSWQVRAGKCVLAVSIEGLPNSHGPGWTGPREFKVVVGDKTCKE